MESVLILLLIVLLLLMIASHVLKPEHQLTFNVVLLVVVIVWVLWRVRFV
jgi:hypothetical protein